MAQIGTVQIAGRTNAGPMEVELNTLAGRTVVRPNDFRYLGSYSLSIPISDTPSSASQISNTGMCGLLNPAHDKLIAIKKVSASFVVVTAAATGGEAALSLIYTRGILAPGQTQSVNLPNCQITNQLPVRMRTNMPNSAAAICVQQVLSAGASKQLFTGQSSGSNAPQVPTLDGNPIAYNAFPLAAAIGAGIPTTVLFDWQTIGFKPLMLEPGDGIEVDIATWPSSSTSVAHVNTTWHWDELAFDWDDMRNEGLQ